MKAYFSLMGALCPEIKQLTNIPFGIYKPPFLTFLVLLCFVFAAKAQEIDVHSTPVAKAGNEAKEGGINPLQIGDPMPEELWTMAFPAVSTKSDAIDQIKLGDYQGKLIILDFWATWCSPCIAMIPTMDSLQNKFGDKIQFLSITYQNKEEVHPFLDNLKSFRGLSLNSIVNESVLHGVFPHRSLPHYVWIDKDGVFRGTTEHSRITEDNINGALVESDFSFVQDLNRTVAKVQSKVVDNKEELSVIPMFYSELKGYQPGLPGKYESYYADSVKGRRVVVQNCPLRTLYKHAFSIDQARIMNNNIILDVEKPEFLTSSLVGLSYDDWLASGFGYSYELIVPFTMAEKLGLFMQEDLSRFFPQYKASIEKRRKPYYSIYVEDKEALEGFRSAGGKASFSMNAFELDVKNQKFSRIIEHFKKTIFQKLLHPVVNESFIDFNIDLKINGTLERLSTFQNALKPYGIGIELKEGDVDVLVIRDVK